MKAAWYERQRAARDVLIIGQMDDPHPHAGEVRIRVAFSGVNPGDVKKREDAFGIGMPYPRVIPHSDGSGTVDAVGEGVSRVAFEVRWVICTSLSRTVGEYWVDAGNAVVVSHKSNERPSPPARHARCARSDDLVRCAL